MADRATGSETAHGPTNEQPAPRLGLGMLGYAFMGKAHSNALKKIPYMLHPPPAIPELVAICGRDEQAVAEAASRFGYRRYYTDWQALVDDPEVQVLDNGGPNHLHAGPSIAAAQAGKHVICEKPLARTAEEAAAMLTAVRQAGVKHMVAYNYRFVPAIRQIRYLIEQGHLGRIYHWRAVYLQEWLLPHFDTPRNWRMEKEAAGSGALGDLGAHIIDLAHYLVGGIQSIKAYARTFIMERPRTEGSEDLAPVEVDDAFVAACEFENGALGTFEATRLAGGRKNFNRFEINGEHASVEFNLERLNEFKIHYHHSEPASTRGWTAVSVTDKAHPWMEYWWPSGHIIGWEHTFVHELVHFLDAIVNDKAIGPHGATFEDGYRAAVIGDAILESASSGRQVDIRYGD